MSSDRIIQSLIECQNALQGLMVNTKALDAIQRAGEWMVDSLKSSHRIYSCGNGGSMCDAMHFAEELSGRFRRDRPPLAAMAISDPAHLSCTANDFGFDFVFSRFIEAHGQKGDTLLAISTSGKSMNIIKAVEAAQAKSMKVIALLGKHDSPLESLADISIVTPGLTAYSDRVQELHIKVIHILIELCEKALFPKLAS